MLWRQGLQTWSLECFQPADCQGSGAAADLGTAVCPPALFLSAPCRPVSSPKMLGEGPGQPAAFAVPAGTAWSSSPLVPSNLNPSAWVVCLLHFSFLLSFCEKKKKEKKKPKQVRVIYNSLIFL